MLLPSLYNLVLLKALPESFRLLAIARRDWDENKFRDYIVESLKQFWGSDIDPAVVDWLTERSFYRKADFNDPSSYETVKTVLERIEIETKSSGNRLFYLAMAPEFIAPVVTQLSRAGLINQNGEPWRRVVIEKPFGNDLDSAIALNGELRKLLREDQIYRIDHFAGKDAVQDLFVFRFSNAVFEPVWNRSAIDNVQITVAETVGLEHRAGYYDKSGALRDMVPNHLMELVSLIAMEPPVSVGTKHLRDKQIEALQSVQRIRPEDVSQWAVRGQYGPGTIQQKNAPGYRQEQGADPNSNTETYVAMKLEIDNWRWSGVPFYLRTGKRLSRETTQIVLSFRKPPAQLFPAVQRDGRLSNRLILNLQPDPGIRLGIGFKAPGLETVVNPAWMDLRFPPGPFGEHSNGYERLLHDVMIGNPTLFQRGEFVEEGWRLVQPLLNDWKNPPKEPFPNYAAGSAGPKAADELLARSGHIWHSLEFT